MAGKSLRRDGGHASRPSGRPGRRGDPKVKRTLSLTAEASRYLDTYALGTNREPWEVIEALIRQHCRRFVLTDRGEAAGGSGSEAPGEG